MFDTDSRLVLGAVATAAALLLVGGAATAVAIDVSDVTGTWLSEDGDLAMEVEVRGDELVGAVVWVEDGQARLDVENDDPSLRDRQVVGLEILRGVSATPEDDDVWRGGSFYDPDTGNLYDSFLKVALEGGELVVQGYPHLSRRRGTFRWSRVSEDELDTR